MEMLDIIHNNCRTIKENRRLQEQKRIIKKQEQERFNKKMCITLFITLVICLAIEITALMI